MIARSGHVNQQVGRGWRASARRWWPLLAPLLFGCAQTRHVTPQRPERSLDAPDILRLRYVSSGASGFVTGEGGACTAIPAEVKDGLFGWQPPGSGAACLHDTLDHGLDPASLTVRWVAVIPKDGDYEVVQGIFGLGAWGKVAVRSSFWGDYFASASVAIEARTPSCHGSWTQLLAAAEATGGWVRTQAFEGGIEVGEVVLSGCRAGEQVQLELRLVGESNRGSVSVDWFGFSAYTANDADSLFGLRARAPGSARGGTRAAHRPAHDPGPPGLPASGSRH